MRFSFYLLLLFVVSVPANSEAADGTYLSPFGPIVSISLLQAGQTYENFVHQGADHIYILHPEDKKVISVEFEPDSQQVELTVVSSSGARLLQTHCSRNVLCRQQLLFAPEPGHSLIFTIRSPSLPDSIHYSLYVTGSPELSDRAKSALTTFDEMQEAEELIAIQDNQSTTLAVAKYQTVLQRWNELKDPLGEAEGLSRLGDAQALLGNNRAALNCYRQASLIFRDLKDGRSIAYTEIRIGEALTRLSATKEAIGHLNVALRYFSDAHDRFGEAATLYNVAIIQFNTGDFFSALTAYRRVFILWNECGEKLSAARTQASIAATHAELKETETAIEIYRQALPVLRGASDRNGTASALIGMGVMYKDFGDFQKALDATYEALDLVKQTGDRRAEAEALNNLGLIYKNSGDVEKALQFYQQSLALRQQVEDVGGEAVTLNNLGLYYQDQSDFSKALDCFEKAFELSRKIGSSQSEALALQYKWQSELGLHNRDLATGDLQRAYEIFVQLGDRSGQASCLETRGRIREDAGEPEEAQKLYVQALTLVRNSNDRPAEARVLLRIARLLRARGELKPAGDNVQESIRILESIRSELLSRSLRISYLSAVRDAYELFVDLLYQMHLVQPQAGYEAIAFRVSEGSRARSLADLLVEPVSAQRGIDPSLIEQQKAVRAALSAAQQKRLEIQARDHPDEEILHATIQIESLQLELEQLESRIRRKNAEVSATHPPPATLREVQQRLLEPDTVLLEFLLGEEKGYAWAVTSTESRMYSIPAAAEIQERVVALYGQLSRIGSENYESEYSKSISSWLAQQLLAPAADLIRDRRILISADGALQYLPFAVLQLPGESRPLGIDHQVSQLPSATSLLLLREEMKNRATPSKWIALFADPVFDPDDPRIHHANGVQRSAHPPQSFSVTRIPFTRREAQAILSLVPRKAAFLATDLDASRETLENTPMKDYKYLHFATHGILDASNPDVSGLLLSLYAGDGRARPGLITAADISRLQLNADLVVLSGCNTALGKQVRGEGLLGIVRAFMDAGAQRVIASLWSVEDAAGVEIMRHFYAGMIRRKLSPAAAMLETRRFLYNQPKFRSPYYWAAFMLVGEYN